MHLLSMAYFPLFNFSSHTPNTENTLIKIVLYNRVTFEQEDRYREKAAHKVEQQNTIVSKCF